MKLIEALEIVRTKPRADAKGMQISLVCGFNPLHLQTFLSARLCMLYPGRAISCNAGLYGDFWGNLHRSEKTQAEAAIVILEWGDLDPRLGLRNLGTWQPGSFEEILENAKNRAAELQEMIRVASSRLPVVICLPTLPLPPISYTPSWQAGTIELDLRRCISELGSQAARFANVRVVNPERLDRLSPLSQRFDAKSELATGFPYKLPHASALADLLSRLIAQSAPKKGLITDLDYTLWSGILGEVGTDGISWDLEHHAHLHGVYQRFLHALAASGVLVGAASKNDPNVVEAALQRQDLILSAKSIFPVEAHWGPKSESIRRILEAWNIGADSVVFIDDTPMELAEVKAAHPEIECIQFPKDDVQALDDLLYRLRDLFGKTLISEEDSIRRESIRRAHTAMSENPGHRNAPAEFLKQAKAELTFSFAKHPLDPRALELINKTNQFNLNGKRFTEGAWQTFMNAPETFLLVASYEDKYGPLGKIAVLAGRSENRRLKLDSWVMSCRAFGRGIEYRCLQELFERFEAEETLLDFQSTVKNGPIRDFLKEVLGANPASPCTIRRDEFWKHRVEHFEQVVVASNE